MRRKIDTSFDVKAGQFVLALGERARRATGLSQKAESHYEKFREMMNSHISVNPARNYSDDDLREDSAYKILMGLYDFENYYGWKYAGSLKTFSYSSPQKVMSRGVIDGVHPLLSQMRYRKMTQTEYDSILDKTHLDLKEAFEKIDNSDKKARKLYSYKTPLSQYLYSFCLSRFDKDYINYLEERGMDEKMRLSLEDKSMKGGNK
jgi:hypothetical protein